MCILPQGGKGRVDCCVTNGESFDSMQVDIVDSGYYVPAFISSIR